MSRVKETHLWFENGDDKIQVESYWKDLNEAIFDLQKTVPDDVVIIDDEIARGCQMIARTNEMRNVRQFSQ